LIGRYGGEEFAVLMPATTAEDAVAVLTAIGADFARLTHVADGVSFHATFSAGVAEARGHADADSLLQAADAALYQAKHAGRNRVVAAAAL
jgi:diguanylate cyclase (GGDEF)-like protein